MKKVIFAIALIAFTGVLATAQTQTVVKEDKKEVKKTSSVPQKVHNTFSKDKKYNGKKVKHTKKVETTTTVPANPQ